MGTKDIWGFSGLTRLMIPVSLLAAQPNKYIRLTRWCNPADRIQTALGEMFFGKWLTNEVQRIAKNKKREAWLIRNHDCDQLVAVVVDRPEGVEWPGMYDEDEA